MVDVLIRMGADIEKDVEGNRLVVHGGKPLHGIQINMNLIPDSLPALSVAAAYAQGDTVFTDLAHVRVKETDRSPSCRSCLPPAAPKWTSPLTQWLSMAAGP